MADFFDHIPDRLKTFIEAQPMFFVATACATGRINLSPKGLDTFRVLSSTSCGYLDLTGSGNETAAHIRHDGRMTIMFNSFTRNALILRLYGSGRVVRPDDGDFAGLIPSFPDLPGARQIILMTVDSVQTSCGYAVPEMELKSERHVLEAWAEKKGADGLKTYRRDNNTVSIDGFETGLEEA